MLTLGPIALREARQFVAQHHRHNEPPRGWLFDTDERSRTPSRASRARRCAHPGSRRTRSSEREQWQHSTGPRSGDKPQLWGEPKMPTESKVRWTKVLATGA